MTKHGDFLRELSALSMRHGVVIGGCGCCGSPWLMQMEPGERGSYEYGEEWGRGAGVQWVRPAADALRGELSDEPK